MCGGLWFKTVYLDVQKYFRPEERGQRDKENEGSYFLFYPLFSCPNFCRTAHYTPHPTFLSPVPLGPSLYFSFLFRTPSFSLLLYASPLVSMGTRFGRGVVLMISPTWWNFVTFLTLFSDSVFRLLTVNLIKKCSVHVFSSFEMFRFLPCLFCHSQ